MNRRDSIRLIPLTLAGIAGITRRAFAQEPGCPKYAPGPIQPNEPLAIQYTKRTRAKLTTLRETQSENLLEAAYVIARTVKNKGVCWSSWDMGHGTSEDMIPDRNGNPEIFKTGIDFTKAKKGDLFLANLWIGGDHQALAKSEVFVIGAPAPWGGDAKRADLIVLDSAKPRLRPYSHLWIDIDISTIDGEVYIPGMPMPIGPFSGAIGMTTYQMMLADACRVLAREGISVKVNGDEPKLSGRKDFEWANLNEPLMDEYFDIVMMQIEMIGAEMGNIRQTARMMVDAVLGGGKVWCYSRYSTLSGEATTRRCGLMSLYGLTDGYTSFTGSPKDIVIMGFYKPDDPVDLKHFDEFRRLGMKVASCGPITRDTKIPDGRTIPKESDVHVGRMTDTYGMFAIPGFEQKICPTSGVLLDQIFWATCMEFVEQMIQHTGGNVPGVFSSTAIKYGREYNNRMSQISIARGY
jgi:uncharacterized phosphosugar-binding protein